MTPVRSTRVALVLLLAAACTPLPIPEDGPYHRADAPLSVTRLVHASLIVEMGSLRAYVDPWLYSGMVLRQSEPLGLRPHALPPADVVLLSGDASDRLDRRALEQIAPRVPLAIAPAKLTSLLRATGFHAVRALTPWEETRVGDVTITAVPTVGAGGANGYVLATPDSSIYVAGPTRPSDNFAAVRAAFPDLDAAILPIGGRRVLGVRREMSPEEAATAARTLGARRVVPVAYGRTGGQPFVWYATDVLARFRDAMARLGLDSEAIVALAPGESWHAWPSPQN